MIFITNVFFFYNMYLKLGFNFRNNYDNDIALIELNGDIVFNERVGPVCLPFKFLNADFANAKFTALGMNGLCMFIYFEEYF